MADFDAENVKSGVIEVAERESDKIFCAALISKPLIAYGLKRTSFGMFV